jgi:hypothetical protein
MVWIAIAVFVVIVASTWWFGVWNLVINLCNFFIAALVASNYFEVAADQIEVVDSTYTYVADFVALWAIFVVTFVVLRAATDLLSRHQLKLPLWMEYAGRSILAPWLAGGFLCFMFFSFHLAPLPPDAFQKELNHKTLGFGPDRMWLAFIQSRSRGALSESKTPPFLPEYRLTDHPDDEGRNLRVFDPHAKFIPTYQRRRMTLASVPNIRVIKQSPTGNQGR